MSNTPSGPWILTCTGKKFYLADPQVESVDIEDIAGALSRMCRFAGHLKVSHEDSIYSIAQHSVYVWKDVIRRFGYVPSYYGLMHDAPEAYYHDITSPLKGLLPGYKPLEVKGYDAIQRKYNWMESNYITDAVKVSDMHMLILESKELTAIPSELWDVPMTTDETIYDIDPDFYCWGPKKAKAEFLLAFECEQSRL